MGLLLGDAHPSVLERLDNPCAKVASDFQSAPLATYPFYHLRLYKNIQRIRIVYHIWYLEVSEPK